MWFKVLALVIAGALLAKAGVALLMGRRFYAMRQRQYASPELPGKMLIAPAVVVSLTGVAWYATLFHYRPWGWVVTASLTLLSCMAVDHLLRWERHRAAMLKVVSSPKVWRIDVALLAVGGAFAALALLVY